MPLNDASALDTAIDLLSRDLWPIPITAPDAPGPSPGKRPIGANWGLERPSETALRGIFRKHPTAGVGLKLGADGGIIDIEIEDMATGPESLSRLLGEMEPHTLGWRSARGPHHLFRWEGRLTRYGKAILKDLPKLPGIEIRLGASEPGSKQFQSVCPPSPTTEGEPRRWNGIDEIAPLPERFFIVLDNLLLQEPEPPARGDMPRAPRTNGDPTGRYARAAFEREISAVQDALEGNRNSQLNESSFALGQLVGAGALDEAEVTAALYDAGRNARLPDAEVRSTVRSGLDAGKAHPRDLSGIGNGRSPAPKAPFAPKGPNGQKTHAFSANGADLGPKTPENGCTFRESGAYSAYGAYGAGPSESQDEEHPVRVEEWPSPPEEAAFTGLVGRIVRVLAPHTESDPVAILVQLLVGFGNLVGRGPYWQVEADRHYTNLFAALVGPSSKGRKGTSWGQVRRRLSELDPAWAEGRVMGGLSSGEGLIWAVRDPIHKAEPVKERGRVVSYQEVMVDAGVSDKRLLALEPELSSVLRTMGREGNTLSALIRRAWDDGNLRTLTKTSPAVATGAHISIVGHITADELGRLLTDTEAANGFGNRFLWACVKRARYLPLGGDSHRIAWGPFDADLRSAVEAARRAGRVELDPWAARRWCDAYHRLSEGRPGLLGAILGRAESQVMRLALIYALLDESEQIQTPHLEAALELWRYCEDSARYAFGDAMGDPDADLLLSAIRSAPDGLSRAEIREDVFQRHKPSAEIAAILGRLLRYGLVRRERRETGGRPAEIWHAAIPQGQTGTPDPATSWLLKWLSLGLAQVEYVFERAAEDGFSAPQIDSAAKVLGVVARRRIGRTFWGLPDAVFWQYYTDWED